jgi:hypothetical protein
VKFRKGRTFSGTVKDVKTGEIKNLKNAMVYENNHGVRFIELSGVGDPACKSCKIQGVIENDEYLTKAASSQLLPHYGGCVGSGSGFMSKVARIENSILMYKGTELYKQASQQELQQLEQVLQTLEQISVGLIKNRKRVEVEFASDLVKILSELQEFTDELTGAGYGQMQGELPAEAGQGIPGVDGTAGGSLEELPPPAEGVPSATGTSIPLSDVGGGGMPSDDQGAVGQVSGSPTKPIVSMPKMPTPPKKPNQASSEDKLNKVAELVATIKNALAVANDGESDKNNEGEADMKRRTPTIASQERQSIQNALSLSLKEKGSVSENEMNYDRKSIIESGGANMSQAKIVTADRTEAPTVLPEKQLDVNIRNHPRTGVEQTSTSEVQLAGERTGVEPQVLTEDQIKGERKDNTPGVLPEKQLAGLRKDNEPNTITQDQLNSNRTNTEPQVLQEKQLDDKSTDLWSRSAMTRTTLKTASEHAKAVIHVIAEAAIKCSATPQQIREAASTLVNGTKARATTLDLVTSATKTQDEDVLTVAERAKYWGGRGITLASTNKADMSASIIAGLRQLVANDTQIGPETIMDVLDVVSSEDKATSSISEVIDDILATPQATKAASVSSRKEILAGIIGGDNVEYLDAPPPDVELRELDIPESSQTATMAQTASQKAKMTKTEKKPDHIIEATLKEIGTTIEEIKLDKMAAKKKISAFVKQVAAMKDVTVESLRTGKDGKKVIMASKVPQLKIANITNVTVDSKDGTVQIAIQTEEGDMKADLELPLDDQGKGVDGAPAEGDATGEGLDKLIAGLPADNAQTPPTAPAPEAPLPTATTAATSSKIQRTAQFGGGSGGGLPGGGPLGGGAEPNAATPQGMPAMDAEQGLQSFTEEDKADDKAPGVGEQMMPGSICPFCHGTDTTTGKKDLPPGAFECNNCGAVYEVHVNIEMLNPENAKFEKGNGDDAEVIEPDLPEMPVAASIQLNKGSIEKIASCEQKYGHVCPACGMTECKPLEKTASKIVYICPSCETKTTKDVLVDMTDKSSFMQVAWNLNPRKVATAGCEECKKAALEYVALVNVTKMMKKASESSQNPKTAFPMANCVEYVARRWGANAVATFGPCKGKPIAECACKQLEAFGMRTRKDIERLASVYAQPDPMDECLKLHVKKGYKQAQAKLICAAMMEKYAKENEKNEWLEAFGSDSRFTTEELRIMKKKANELLTRKAQIEMPKDNLDADLGAPLDDVKPIDDETAIIDGETDDTITVEIPKEVAADLAGQIDVQTEEAIQTGDDTTLPEMPPETSPEMPPIDDSTASDVSIEASGKRTVRVAAKPNKVEDISVGVAGKVKGGTKTLGNEGPSNIDVPASKPVIPSNPKGSKIKGEVQTIPEAIEPDIAKDNSLMGDEANTQKGMPPISLDTRGRVIAEGNQEQITKEAAKPKLVEDISVGVEGKVKNGQKPIGNESKDNILVDAKKPVIPSKDSLDVTLPDIPVDHATMEGEKTTKGIGTDTPPINNDIRGRVIADGKRDRQIERIAAARHKKACQVAAKLMGFGRIASEDYDAVVEDLAKIEVDRIEAFAERMFKNTKTASAQQVTLSTPIVQEASAYQPEMPKTMADALKGIFTIGTKQLNDAIQEEDKLAASQE